MDTKDQSVEFSEDAEELAKEIYMPMETFGKYSGYSTDPDINPNYIRPAIFQQRLQKVMDEYVGGVATWYMTSKTMLEEGFKYLSMIKEDADHMAAENLHELLRAWENFHRLLAEAMRGTSISVKRTRGITTAEISFPLMMITGSALSIPLTTTRAASGTSSSVIITSW